MFLKKHKYRIKTIRLRGQISQGLILHLNLFKETFLDLNLIVGTDVTKLL
jgi:hypothetical protein